MESSEKQRILTAYDRASLVALLAHRGLYVIGERWRGHACGTAAEADPAESPAVAPGAAGAAGTDAR